MNPDAERTRVDKWLWAARFYKTRSIAAEAVESGNVLVNGARVKPARPLKLSDELLVRVPGADYIVRVQALSERRGPAVEAAKLYAETEDSKRKREELKRSRTAREPTMFIRGRPTKRARRQLDRLREPDE